MNFKKFLAISLSLVLMVIGNSAPATAAQQQWGAAYLDWTGALLSDKSSMSQVIQPLEISPRMYWEAGWHWDNIPDGGYGGIQSGGILADGKISDLAIFSIWNGLGAVPGVGAGCTPFGGEGIGYSCRIPITLIAGNKYEISFGVDTARGPQWWIASISDLAKGTKSVIGSIETNSSVAKATNWNNFIEYWGQAVPCDAVGAASAKFYTPTSNNPDVEVSSPRFSRPAQPCAMSAGDTPPKGFIGDAVIRFGGVKQDPSTETLPFIKTRAQLAAEKTEAEVKAAAELKAKQEAEAQAAAELIAKQEAEAKAAAELKAKQEAEAKAAAELKAKQEAEAEAALEKAAAELKAKQEAEAKAAAELKAKQEAEAKTALAAKKKITITCVKGKLTKKVTAVKPTCPKGYKKK